MEIPYVCLFIICSMIAALRRDIDINITYWVPLSERMDDYNHNITKSIIMVPVLMDIVDLNGFDGVAGIPLVGCIPITPINHNSSLFGIINGSFHWFWLFCCWIANFNPLGMRHLQQSNHSMNLSLFDGRWTNI